METVPRKVFIAANWRSNGVRLFTNQQSQFLSTLEFDRQTTEVAVCLPYIHLQAAKIFLVGQYIVASQNVSMYDNGPYTGEISAKQLMDIGIDWTIVGQSERRIIFGEDNNVIAEKLKRVFEQKMFAIVCVGDSKEDKENNKSLEVIDAQLNSILEVSKENWDHLVICYEPIWAKDFGKNVNKSAYDPIWAKYTGESVEQGWIQSVHEHIRNFIKGKLGEPYAKSTRIIYGGEVTEQNCKEIILINDVDGFLVGDISLKSEFKTVIESAKLKKYESRID